MKNGFDAAQSQITRGNFNRFVATHFAGLRRLQNGHTQPLQATIVSGPKKCHLRPALAGHQRRRQSQGHARHERHRKNLPPHDHRRRSQRRPWVVDLASYPRGGFAALQSAGVSAEQQLHLLNGLGHGGASPKVGAMGEGGRCAVKSKRGVHSSTPKACASQSRLIGGRERPIGSQVFPGLCLVCISPPVESIKTAPTNPGRWLLMQSAHDFSSWADAASHSRNP